MRLEAYPPYDEQINLICVSPLDAPQAYPPNNHQRISIVGYANKGAPALNRLPATILIQGEPADKTRAQQGLLQ